uniref:Serpin domain-containing protein n=1 Tax=Denticeps clupeoides TaxID=299321 RepID=A0AAY4D271_9TELE
MKTKTLKCGSNYTWLWLEILNSDDDNHKHLHHDKDQPHHHHGPEANVLFAQNAGFAFNLYNKLRALNDSQGKNIFFSPLSISMALSMLSLGAKGDTHTQIYKALGFSDLSPEKVNEGFEHIFHMIGHKKDNLQLDVGNAVAMKKNGIKVLDKFLEDAKHYYESEAFMIDFKKSEVAAEEINKFIAQKTNNTITDMVKDLDPNTVMMLINCMYFRGEWERHFNPENSIKADFNVDENKKVSVDMMYRQGFYDFYEDKENFTTVIRLPYKCDASMFIILPDEGKMKDHKKTRTYVLSLELGMPKFKISGSYNLNGILKEMGVDHAFDGNADFSGMTTSKVAVSEVEHKAILNVDEKGTEASAATTIEIVDMSTLDQPKTVIINRPFMVFITDHTTRSLLFIGKITDPTAN